MGIRVCLNSLVKGFVNERVIIALTQHIGHDAPATEIQDGAQIKFMYLNTLIPFELRHIGKPFLIRLLRIELAVQQVFSKIPGVLGLSGATTIIVIHGGSYISIPADAQPCGPASRKPICSKRNGLHGAARRLPQPEIPVPHGTL